MSLWIGFNLCVDLVYSQLPKVDLPSISTPTISIYISPSGNNANPGTQAQPVATFQQALSLIPFNSMADVNGEIVWLPGNYYPTQPMVQNIADYQQGNYHKHISLRGIGEVHIYGNNSNGNHLIWLRGSGIKVENLHLHQAKGCGIIISNPNANGGFSAANKIQDVIIKDISVDSTVSHSVITTYCNRLLYQHVTISNGQQENTGVNGNCQWGSALRAELSTHITIRDCRVFHNRGEGINVATSTNALVEGCISYDNFAPNFYCIRSNKVIFRKNLAYNKDSIYWRNCQSDNGGKPQPRKPSSGISIANEVSYSDMINNTCSSVRTHSNGAFTNGIADSIFVYNNIFILAPFILTDESISNCLVTNANNFSNIFIENNTFIGDISATHPYLNQTPLVTMIFDQTYFWGCPFSVDGRGVYRCDNLVWKNNIVSAQDSMNHQNIPPVFILYGGRPCNGGSLPSKFTAANNLWHQTLPMVYDHYAGNSIPNFLQGTSDLIKPSMITSCDPEVSLLPLVPSSNAGLNNAWYRQVPVSSYILDDFWNNIRHTGKSNVGALEADVAQGMPVQNRAAEIKLFPNPTPGIVTLQAPEATSDWVSGVYNLMGQAVPFSVDTMGGKVQISLKELPSGIYYVKLVTTLGVIWLPCYKTSF